MYIKSIILDGFKSYGQRTEVHGFDRQFNAITGLNGSGKSNLLDSICFVLGITNTSLVRANSLQDLIFKSGQAGINKATVTLVFDNSNTDQSPPGLEGCKEITVTRQVAMGGKNKYMLNGSTVTQGKIQDMFCSVQLNVNNPHFLIMQGRVTKVLNMRPMEILSMIEEAAGTRMYENKKQNALKSIEKKDAKLQEIRGILTEEITPKLEQLKAERAAFLAYERLERELQYWMGLYEACKYRQIQKQLVASKNAFENGQEKVACFKDSIKANKAIIIELDNEIKELSERAETSNSNNLKQLEAELKQCELANVKAISVVKATKENIATEENKKKQLLKNLKEDENALTAKESELSKVESVFKKLKENEAVDKEAYTASQQKFEALNVGMEVNDEGKAETLQEQLMNAKSEGAQAATIIKQATMKLSHFQSEITAKERELGSNSEEFSKDNQMLKKIESEIQSLENNLKKMNYSEERMQELQIKRRELMKEHTTVQENVENFAARRPYSQFNYTNPIPNFDKRRVFGVVCRLITLKDKKAATALQEVAGGRLYNVVIDTQETGNLLLKKGNLQQRVTFIPMNKIRSGKISDNTVKFAQSLVGTENVCSALSLITYDNKLQAAMEFVFGNTLVCKDLNVARQVAFHPNIKKRCVTLDGDVVDPAGILTGGARDKSSSVLLQLEAIKGYEGRLVEIQEELKRVETEMMQMNKVQENWRGINNQLEMKRHDLRLIEQRLKQTSHHQLQEEINGLKATIEQLTEEISVAKETEAKCIKKAKDLELKIGDSKGYKEKQLKEAESEMNRLKVKAEKSQQEWKKREQEYETLVLEISELKKEIENIKEQITACEEELKHLTEQLQSQTVEAERTKGIVDEQQKALKAEKAAVAEKNKEVQKKIQRKENLAQEISNHELEMKKLEHEMKTLETDYRNCVAKEKEYADRCSEKNLKEVENYSDKEAADLEKRIRAAQETQKKQSKTVNLKAKAMYEKEEKQYASLTKKIRIIENDKKHILRVVDNLEKRKKEAIILAYEQITRDFGSIFGTLLPGANAKLQPLQNKSPLEGLEIKVSLGGVWKNSLNELSGGQRSLVALSLILAMLLFKPAPLYILDEVDAALDLSHTQNIGNMLRAHFKQSQFILVSLKEGMYGNANVLFHTKFTDGLSHVTRTVHNLSK